MRWVWLLLCAPTVLLSGCAGKIDGSCPTPDAGAATALDDAGPTPAIPATQPIEAPDSSASVAPDAATMTEPKECTTYQDCFDRYGPTYFCFSGRCQNVMCTTEGTACAMPNRECCNLGDGTLACVEGTCCTDAQCSAPERCVDHACK